MKILLNITVLFFVLFATQGCKKDETTTTTTTTAPIDLLTGGTQKTWYLKGAKLASTVVYQSCHADDTIFFTKTGLTFAQKVGTKCNITETDTFGTFEISSDGKTVNLKSGTTTVVATVIELTSTTLSVKATTDFGVAELVYSSTL